jgi:energy-converting hydrogenase Eha subunit G
VVSTVPFVGCLEGCSGVSSRGLFGTLLGFEATGFLCPGFSGSCRVCGAGWGGWVRGFVGFVLVPCFAGPALCGCGG